MIRVVSMLSAAALVLVACAGSDDQMADDPVATPAPAAAAESTEPMSGDPSPDVPDASAAVDAPELLRFTAPLVGGGELDAATTAGTPTAFWFWSPT